MPTSRLCESFRSLAFETFTQLGRARRLDHQILEETLTDINLLELKDRNASEIFCRSFSKWQEGKNGADWEWWLTNQRQTSWLGLRVQAKVLHLKTDTFAHLHYKRGLAYQTTRLKTAAAAEGLVPLYCFYLHHSNLAASASSRCGTFPHAAESYGCSLSLVDHVERLRKLKRNDLQAVLDGAFPWHCLVCCSGFGGADLPSRAWNFLIESLGMSGALQQRRGADNAVTEVGPRGRPPAHVLAVMEGLEPEAAPQGVRGVLVIRGHE